MKKFISAISVIVMLCAFSTTAFAATLDSNTKSDSHDVWAKYNSGVSTPDVYSVEVAWGAMEFTYNVTGTKDWNAVDHSYTDHFLTSWSEKGNTVTVTNHSNVAVTAYFRFKKDNAISENIIDKFDVDNKQLAAGVEGGYESADTVTSTLSIDGVLDSAKTEFTKIGSVTVTIV